MQGYIDQEGRQPTMVARYDVNLHVAMGSGAFSGSRMVTIAPTFVLVNAADVPIEVCHARSRVVVTLEPGEARPWTWFMSDGRPELLARPVGTAVDWCWSGRFSIAEVGNYHVRLIAEKSMATYTIFPIGITMQARPAAGSCGTSMPVCVLRIVSCTFDSCMAALKIAAYTHARHSFCMACVARTRM